MRALYMRAFYVSLLVALAFGCQKTPQPTDAGGAPDAALEAALDAGPPFPAQLELEVEAKLADGGTALLQANGDERPVIDPATGLLLRTNLALRNYRIRVFDEADRALVSDDRADELPEALRYEISFAEPLKSGFRYALVVDAQSGPQVLDHQGNGHPDVRLEFKISGEKQKPAPKQPQRKKKKKR